MGLGIRTLTDSLGRCDVLSFAPIRIVSGSVAAVQSGAVQVETWCQLVLNKFTPVHTGATWPLMANQSAGPQFVMQTLYESLRGQCIYNKR